MVEILPNIHQILVNYHDRPLKLYLLLGQSASILMDTGDAAVPDKDILPAFASLGFDPKRLTYVMATHPDVDHTGGLARLRQAAPNAAFVCGTTDRAQIESPEALVDLRYRLYWQTDGIGPDDAARAKMLPRCGAYVPFSFTFAGGEELRLGPNWIGKILHLPGHSHGHLGVYFPEQKTAIIADAVHGRANCFLDGRAAFACTYMYIEEYLGTIAQLEALGLERLYSCHWPDQIGKDAVAAWLALSRDYALMADAVVGEAVRGAGPGGVTLRDLCLQTKSKLGDWPAERDLDAKFMVGGHLEHWMGLGKVKVEGMSPRRFTWVG